MQAVSILKLSGNRVIRIFQQVFLTLVGFFLIAVALGFYLNNCKFGMPLGLAAGHGDLPKVKEIVAASPELVNSYPDGATPLHYAAIHGHLDVVKHLVEHGADVGAINERGLTAEQKARSAGEEETAEYLKRIAAAQK